MTHVLTSCPCGVICYLLSNVSTLGIKGEALFNNAIHGHSNPKEIWPVFPVSSAKVLRHCCLVLWDNGVRHAHSHHTLVVQASFYPHVLFQIPNHSTNDLRCIGVGRFVDDTACGYDTNYTVVL